MMMTAMAMKPVQTAEVSSANDLREITLPLIERKKGRKEGCWGFPSFSEFRLPVDVGLVSFGWH